MSDLTKSASAILMAHEIYHYALRSIASGDEHPQSTARSALDEAREVADLSEQDDEQ